MRGNPLTRVSNRRRAGAPRSRSPLTAAGVSVGARRGGPDRAAVRREGVVEERGVFDDDLIAVVGRAEWGAVGVEAADVVHVAIGHAVVRKRRAEKSFGQRFVIVGHSGGRDRRCANQRGGQHR